MNRKREWVWRKPIKLLPYHLPDLIKSDEVLITEGEKDADTAFNLGFVSTTNPYGAGKWRQEYNIYFQNKRIVMIPHEDETGLRHANSVELNLKPIADKFEIFRISAIHTCAKDLTEFIESSDKEGEEKLKEHIRRLFRVTFQMPIDIRDFLNKEITKSRSLWGDGIIDKNSKVVISGPGKIGKTNFSLNLAFALATGKTFLDIPILKKTKVLYLQQEISEANLQKRLKIMQAKINELEPGCLFCNTIKGFDLLKNEHLNHLKKWLEQGNFEVIFLDPLYKFHNQDENSAQEMKNLLDILDNLANEFNLCIILLHHHRKIYTNEEHSFQQLRGSSVLFDWGDTYIILNYHKKDKEVIRLDWKTRNAKEPPSILIKKDESLWYTKVANLGSRKHLVSEILEDVKLLLNQRGSIPQKEIIEQITSQRKISEGTVRNLLKEGEKQGLLKSKTSGRSRIWDLKQVQS